MTAVSGQCDPKEEFFIALVSLLIAPLAPILIELGFTYSVSSGTLLVSAIMYVASMAFTTDRKYIFFIGFGAVAYLCLVYGAALHVAVVAESAPSVAPLQEIFQRDPAFGDGQGVLPNVAQDTPTSEFTLSVVASTSVYFSAVVLMLGFGIAHLLQRIRMHLKESQPFLDFRVSNRNGKS